MISAEDLAVLIGGEDYDAAKVEELERGAVAFVETQTGRYFGPPELVEEFIVGRGTARIYLRDHPTYADEYEATQVEVLAQAVPGGDASELTQDSDFQLRIGDREFSLVRLLGGVWTAGYEYAATYLRGYQAGEEPADIRDLVLSLVRTRWENLAAERLGLKSETIGGYSYTRFGDDDLAACGGTATIEAWRRPVFA